MKIVALIPAHNEEDSIADTIEALLAQDRPADQVVVIPNGCTDATAEVARRYQVTVYELPSLPHRKSQALNMAWMKYATRSDLVVCLDADTVLPPNAVGDWEKEFEIDPLLGGSSSKFTMQAPDFLSRLQKAEFATWTDVSLQRGKTHVLAGTGCAILNEALWKVVRATDRIGPWSYKSTTEDFELTYQIRKLGYYCQVSPTVRAYTDSMKTIKSLWGQRMKWQVGTIEDLIAVGLNRLTFRDWFQQGAGIFNASLKLLWLFVIISAELEHTLHFVLFWWLLPILFVALDVKRAWRIPHRDKIDVLIAATFFPMEFFSWLRSAWFVVSWCAYFKQKLTGIHVDRWSNQYALERS